MRPVSQQFLAALSGSHRMRARARVVTGHQTGVTPTGTEIPILDGNVELDASAQVRASLDLTTDGTDWEPRPSEPISPYGNQVYVERGLDFGEGHIEWVGLGYFQIRSANQPVKTGDPVRITAMDRMAAIVDYIMLTPRQFTANHTIEQVVESLVFDVYPDAVISYDFVPSAVALNRKLLVEEDRYGALLDVVTSIGKTMFWNHKGELRLQSVPSPSNPVWDVKAGKDGVLLERNRNISREGVFNAVIATGESSDDIPPVRAIAYDNAPNSPTYWSGPFGKVPRMYSSERITTVAQAQGAARAILQQSLGMPYQIDLTAIANPALEPLDPVRVVGANGDAEIHVLDRMNIPLTVDAAMTGATREATEQNIGEG